MTGENEHSHDDVFDIHITQSGQGFEISLAALRQALVSGSEEIRFTAPDGFRFGDDRRLHPDTATEHSGHPDDQENTMNNDERYTSEDPEDERATPRLDDTLSQQPPWHTGPEWSEIGRASCRERVLCVV